MTDTTLTDRTGAAVEVRPLEGRDAYGIFFTGEDNPVGHADFLDREGRDGVDGPERIFHHTVVDPAYGGRGLAGVLTEQALAETKAQGYTVVPVCTYVAGWIAKNNWDGNTAPVTDDVQEWVADQD